MRKFAEGMKQPNHEEVAKKGAWYTKDPQKAASVEQAGTFAPRKQGVAEQKTQTAALSEDTGWPWRGSPWGTETT
jgi:hypothetical protein